MQLQTLKTKVRETGRKGLAAHTRNTGFVPAVMYGARKEAVSLAVERKALEKILHTEGGMHAVVQLDFEDAPEHSSPALLKEVQRHPYRERLVHADFMRIRLDERVHTRVTVVLKGRAKGVIDGGVVDQQIREVEIECLALEIPEHIEVDITNLGMGESIHVADLVVPEGVTVVTDAELGIAAIHAPRVLKTAEEEAAEAAEAAETTEAAEAAEAEE